MGYMGVASGCGCKEVYRFPHISYPTPLVTFCLFKKMFFVLVYI